MSPKRDRLFRWGGGMLAMAGLLTVFLFQRTDVAGFVGIGGSEIQRFLFNRTIRFIVNDIFAIGLIYALFPQRKYIIFALWVQLAGIVFILVPYFIMKLYFPSYNGPLLSFLHRLILNPILLLLLIPSFYYQRKSS
jgi:exosortase F-associated protein